MVPTPLRELNQSTRPGSSEVNWYLVAMVTVAIAISYFDRQTLPVAISSIERTIPLSDQQFSWLQFAFLIPYSLLYAGGGRLLEPYGFSERGGDDLPQFKYRHHIWSSHINGLARINRQRGHSCCRRIPDVDRIEAHAVAKILDALIEFLRIELDIAERVKSTMIVRANR